MFNSLRDTEHRHLLSMILQAMGIQRYMFFSIHNCDKHPEVPLMQMKTCTEQYLRDSGLDYTIFRLCGFMQVMPWLAVFCMLYLHYLLHVCQDNLMVWQLCGTFFNSPSSSTLSANDACIVHVLHMALAQKYLFWSVSSSVNHMCRLSLETMLSQSWRTSRYGEPVTTPALHTWTAKMLPGWL